MSLNECTLYELLPAIYRIRDAEQGRPVEALLKVIAREIAVLDENLDQLYDDQFIETCAEWVVPYLGDLIGYRAVHGLARGAVHGRAEVAHTIGFRRRKGTAAVLEQLARDVTGWPARVVEFFELLAATQSMNHPRPKCVAAPDLRRWEPLERLNSAFESTPHTVDVRSIVAGDGKYNIPQVGIFLWRWNAYSLTKSSAAKLNEVDGDQRFLFSPLGQNMPLFTRPRPEGDVAGLAQPIHVPEPISRRVLDAHLADYYGEANSLAIYNDGVLIPGDQIEVCDLSDVPGGTWAHEPSVGKVAVDPVLGRFVFSSATAVKQPRVTFHYGFSAELGGGEYERESSFAADLVRLGTRISVPQDQPTIHAALVALGSSSGIIEITDSDRHAWPAVVHAAAAQHIEIRGANGCRPTLILAGDAALTGAVDAKIMLNGLLMTGGGLRVPAIDNQLATLRLSHCTLVPGRSLAVDGQPNQPGAVNLTVESAVTKVAIDHAIVGALRIAVSADMTVRDSIVDANLETNLAYADETGLEPGAPLRIQNSTVIGRVHTAAFELASNVLFVSQGIAVGKLRDPVLAARKQAGCVRFSFLPDGSRVPRRFRCQPDTTIGQVLEAAKKHAGKLSSAKLSQLASEVRAWLRPGFTDLRYGQPGYAQLRSASPAEIRSGADDESEMGAFHELQQTRREANLRIRLDEYLRLGLEAGVFYCT